MPRDNKEDILLDYAFISLMPSKIRVLVIGGGRAGYIKAESFLKKGYIVTVVSLEFSKDLELLFYNYERHIRLLKEPYKKEHILEKHLIVIATDDSSLNKVIREDCEEYAKIYLYAEDSRCGNFISPVELETRNLKLGLHTKVGSPKTSLFLKEELREYLSEYDDFLDYIGKIRRHLLVTLKDKKLNLEAMNFLNTDDFYFFYKKNKHILVLKLFWGDELDF